MLGAALHPSNQGRQLAFKGLIASGAPQHAAFLKFVEGFPADGANQGGAFLPLGHIGKHGGQHRLQISRFIFFHALPAQMPAGGVAVHHGGHQHLRRIFFAFLAQHAFFLPSFEDSPTILCFFAARAPQEKSGGRNEAARFTPPPGADAPRKAA